MMPGKRRIDQDTGCAEITAKVTTLGTMRRCSSWLNQFVCYIEANKEGVG